MNLAGRRGLVQHLMKRWVCWFFLLGFFLEFPEIYFYKRIIIMRVDMWETPI
jgi:hypothetical protein